MVEDASVAQARILLASLYEQSQSPKLRTCLAGGKPQDVSPLPDIGEPLQRRGMSRHAHNYRAKYSVLSPHKRARHAAYSKVFMRT